MNGPSLSLGSSYYPPAPLQTDNPDRDFKKAKKLPLPQNLRQMLPFPETPWKMNKDLVKRLQFPPSSAMEKYRKLELVSSDPESGFVHLVFNHDRPTNRSIRKIHCMHNPSLTHAFETNLPLLEEQASNLVFAPNLDKETNAPLRKQALQRWQSAATLFSPFKLEVASFKTQELTKTYILPLWHGASKPVCESIANTGFTYFGMHSYKQDADISYFGNGIYFTNSARYCSKSYGKEHMLLAWVSMRQPFPVVADHPAKSPDDEPLDKAMLKGRGAYKNYNAHYIPVLKVCTPNKPTVHYPCAEGQQAQYDEIVVFTGHQTLPRFWIELAVDLPRSPSSSFSSSSSSSPSSISSSSSSRFQTLGALLDKLCALTDIPGVQQEVELRLFLESSIQTFLSEDPTTPLSSQHFLLANAVDRLLDQNGKVRRVVAQGLLAKNKEGIAQRQLGAKSVALSVDSSLLPSPILNMPILGETDPLEKSTHLASKEKEKKRMSGPLPQASLSHPPSVRLVTTPSTMSYGPDSKPQVLSGHRGRVNCLAQLTDGRLVSGSWDHTVRIWPLDGSAPIVLKEHTRIISCLVQLADGRIASGSNDGTVRIWPLDGSPPTVLKGHTAEIACLVQLADGRIVSGANDGTWIWSLDGSAPMILEKHEARITCFAELADGRIASGASDGTVRIWPLDGSTPRVLKGHTDGLSCLTQLADGRIASCSYDNTVRLWPLNGSPHTVLTGHTDGVSCLTQLVDGRIASGAADKTVRIWPLDGSTPMILKGHTRLVSCLARLVDGRIASGSNDGTVRIWPLDGSPPTVLEGHTGGVGCLTQLADGRIASGASDGSVRIFGKEADSLSQRSLIPKAKEKERKKMSDALPLASLSDSSGIRLVELERSIRPLLVIPSNLLQKGQPLMITDKVVTYLDGRSAVWLLTSCRDLKKVSLAQTLYAILLKRDFPALYQPLASRVFKQPQSEQGLLWQRLYALSHGPDPEPQVLRGHKNAVTGLAQLADGRIASGSGWTDSTLRIWTLDGSPPTVLKGHTSGVTCLTQLTDGRIASGSFDSTVRIWPLDGSAPTVLTGHTSEVWCLTQLADGRIASVGSTDRTVRIWSLDGSNPTVLKGHTNPVNCLTQLADGRIASGSNDCTVRIWTLDGSPPTVLRGHTDGVSCLMQLTDGSIASGGGSYDPTVRIWSLDGSNPTVLTGHTDWVWCLAQLADGRIASGSFDSTVRIWPLDGSPPTVLTGHTDRVSCLAQLADGRIASGSYDHTVRIWPLDGSPPTVLTGHTDYVDCLMQLADGRIASGSCDETVRIWGKDPASLSQRSLIPKAKEKERKKMSDALPLASLSDSSGIRLVELERSIRPLLVIPSDLLQKGQPLMITDKVVTYLDGRSAVRLLTSCRDLKKVSLAQTLYATLLKRDSPALYQPLASRVFKQPQSEQGLLWQRLYALSQGPDPRPQVISEHRERVSCLTPLIDGRLASGSWDHTVGIWSLDDDSPPTVLKGHTDVVTCLVQLVDGRIASGSGSRDGTVRIWPLNGSTPTVLKGHTWSVNCLAQLADGRIASGSDDGTVRIWPLNGSTPTVLNGHTGGVGCLVQLVDGRIASGSYDCTVRIWPLNGSTPIVLTGHTDEVTGLLQLADGRIASCSNDKTVRIWPLDDSTPTVLKGHTCMVECITQLADGRIASGSNDDTVRIWPLDGSPPTVLTGHAGLVTCLAQLADGRIASGSAFPDCTMRIWPLDGSTPKVLFGHAAMVLCLTQLADGRIASGSRDHMVRIWGKNPASLFQKALPPKAIVTKAKDTQK